MSITPLYAALFGLMLVLLSARVIRLRWHYRVAIGSRGEKALERAIRVQANFVEYVPLTLLLLFLLELQAGASLMIHLLCAMLLVGRVLHALGVSRVEEVLLVRQIGMGLTFGVLVAASILLLLNVLSG